MEKYKKYIFGAIFLILTVVTYVLISSSDSRSYLKVINSALAENETIYGGLNPIDTLRLFSDSLEQSGIEDALVYVSDSNKKLVRDYLNQLKDSNQLNDFILNIRSYSEKDVSYLNNTAEISYKTVLNRSMKIKIGNQEFSVPGGEYIGLIIFQKHTEGVWQIRAI